jgi:Ca2+-transporting ATPase
MATGLSLDDLVYVGMVGIIDPERPQVAEAVSQLKTGGVLVKMITGDAEKTAKAIGKIKLFYNLIEIFSIILASRLKIYNTNDLSLSGEDLDHMSTTELDTAIAKATVFYRVSPKHKLTIVKVNFSKTDIYISIKIFSSDFTSTRTYRWYDR